MIIEWPTGLSPRIINLRPINKTRSAGESLTGFEQVAGSLATRWAFSLEFNNLKRHLIPAYRAMVASLEGRANALRVPVFDPQFWPSDAVIGIASVPHSDGTPLSDGSEYLTADVDGITATGLKGAKVLTGGVVPDGAGFFYPPTVLGDVPPNARVFQEEIFGPVAPITTFDDEEEVLARANDTEFGLVAYFFTKDNARVIRVSETLEYGMVGVNTGIVSNPAAPFGGMKHSGFGREGGFEGIDEYLEVKYVGMAGL